MKNNKRLLIIVFTFLFTVFASISNIPAQAAVKKTIVPEVQFANAPVTEYTAGDRVQFNINSPNYGGKVEYRVVLWDDSKKSYKDLWNETNGYPNRYYTKWQPTGNTIFTLGWPIVEPGNYRITVYAKRVGVASSKAALTGMNCDSYKQSVAFTVKPKVTLLDKEGHTYGSSDANKLETYKGDTKITANNIALSNAKVEGNLYISGDNAVIKNVSATGKIAVDPGKDGSTTLEDVTAKNIEVLSGGQNSIHIKNVQAETMNVSSSTPVRVEADGDTEIVSTSASGYVIFDRKSGTYGTITISEGSDGTPVIEFRGDIQDNVQVETTATIKTAENSKVSNLVINTEKVTDTVKLEGQYDKVEVAKEAKVEIGETAVITDSLKVSAEAEIKADEKAVVQKVDIATAANDTVKLEGTFAKVEINSEAKVEVAANTKIENIVANTNAEINLDKTAVVDNVDKGSSTVVVGGEGTVGTGTTTSPSTGGAGGGYTPPENTPQTMSITGISVTSATSITFNSSVAGATIKWNGTTLSIQTVSGTNTITVPKITLGASNTLVVEKSGYTTFSKNDVIWTAPAAKGTIGLSDTLNGGVNTTYTIDGYHMTFGGKIKYYQAQEDGAFIAGNWVGVKITAPEGITPGDDTTATINNGEPTVGWGNIREEPDKYNYFYLFIRVRDIARTYSIEMKWNNEVTETFLVDFAPTTTLEVLKADLGNMIDGARYNYDNAANYGEISDTAVQAFNDAINAAQEVYDNAVNAKTEAVQAGVYAAQDELIAAQDAFFDAYNTTVEVVSYNMTANTTYTDTDPLIITLGLKNGIGDFVTENTDYITLGGDLSQMSIKTVTFEGDPANRAILELTGTLGDTLNNAAISIAEGGVNGHKHGFDAVTVPGAKGTIELSGQLNGGVNTTYTIDGYHMTFDGEIKYYQAGEEGTFIGGNWVGVKITAPEGIMPGDDTVSTISGQPSVTGWNNIRVEGDGDNYFYLYIRVRDITRTYSIEMKWNNEVTETFLADFAPTTTLEVLKADLGDMIDGARYNYDNAVNYGEISDTAVQAFYDAINTSQEVYDNAVDAKTEAVQAGVYAAQDKLIAAQDAFFDAYNTTVEAVSYNMAANTTYTDTDPLIITLSLKNGIGHFVTENTGYITLGGDLSQMSIKSVSFEGDPANRAILELTGALGDSMNNAAISIAEGGVNGHKHGFDVLLVQQ